ncbi:MAG TPA: hypothetical protein PKD00_00560 [Burkholderiales bacterium]|nr:hypothetical protein [Burkholderiales bacterium]
MLLTVSNGSFTISPDLIDYVGVVEQDGYIHDVNKSVTGYRYVLEIAEKHSMALVLTDTEENLNNVREQILEQVKKAHKAK